MQQMLFEIEQCERSRRRWIMETDPAEVARVLGFYPPGYVPRTYIVTCGAAKLQRRAKACEMYTGSYHRAALAWALSVAPRGDIYILSAKHGLLALDVELDPYNVRLGMPEAITPHGLRIIGNRMAIAARPIVAVGGQEYLELLDLAFPDLEITVPTTGGLGEQIGQLRRNVGKLANEWPTPEWRRFGSSKTKGHAYYYRDTEWRVQHCGHPTANFPWYVIAPSGDSASGRTWMHLDQAKAELVRLVGESR